MSAFLRARMMCPVTRHRADKSLHEAPAQLQTKRRSQMDNRYLPLWDKMISESARGGPSRYRSDHHGTHPQTQHLAELRLLREERPHRVLKLKLPRFGAMQIRLPMWALIGRPSA